MFKSAGVISSLSGSTLLGPEAVAGELAILGAIIAFRKIKNKVQDNKQRKTNERNQSQAQAQAEADRQK